MKIVRENINFERDMDPKEAMGLGLITVGIDFQNILYDEDQWDAGIMEFALWDPETKETYDQLKQIGVKWEIPFSTDIENPEIIFTGTRDQIARVIAEVYLGEDLQTVKAGMAKWNGKNIDDLWEILGF